MFAIAAPVQGTSGIHGIEHVAHVCCRRWRSSGAEALVAGCTDTVGVFSSTGLVDDCSAFEQSCAMEPEQVVLGQADVAVDERGELD
jgi:hypothetical protein